MTFYLQVASAVINGSNFGSLNSTLDFAHAASIRKISFSCSSLGRVTHTHSNCILCSDRKTSLNIHSSAFGGVVLADLDILAIVVKDPMYAGRS